jgi:hypothetical protein
MLFAGYVYRSRDREFKPPLHEQARIALSRSKVGKKGMDIRFAKVLENRM